MVLPLLKRHIRWYRGPFRRFINNRLKKKKYKKEMNRSNKSKQNKKKRKKEKECITGITSAIWQHAAHTTDQLTSFSC